MMPYMFMPMPVSMADGMFVPMFNFNMPMLPMLSPPSIALPPLPTTLPPPPQHVGASHHVSTHMYAHARHVSGPARAAAPPSFHDPLETFSEEHIQVLIMSHLASLATKQSMAARNTGLVPIAPVDISINIKDITQCFRGGASLFLAIAADRLQASRIWSGCGCWRRPSTPTR